MSMRQMEEKQNTHPYIIACGDSVDEITHYFIVLESHLMSVSSYELNINSFPVLHFSTRIKFDYSSTFQVPDDYGIVQTFDLFLKSHKSIGLHFDPSIAAMANFCLHFFYGIKALSRPSPLLKSLCERIKKVD